MGGQRLHGPGRGRGGRSRPHRAHTQAAEPPLQCPWGTGGSSGDINISAQPVMPPELEHDMAGWRRGRLQPPGAPRLEISRPAGPGCAAHEMGNGGSARACGRPAPPSPSLGVCPTPRLSCHSARPAGLCPHPPGSRIRQALGRPKGSQCSITWQSQQLGALGPAPSRPALVPAWGRTVTGMACSTPCTQVAPWHRALGPV